MDDGHVDKGTKGTKKCVIKLEIKFEDYKKCLEIYKTILRSQKWFRNELINVFTESKRLPLVQMVIREYKCYLIYPYGIGPWRVCKTEFMRYPPKEIGYND